MKMSESKIRYIMYCRKSSDSEDRQVQSIDDQKRELEPLIESRNLKVIKIFGESQSAKHPGRSDFDEMITMLENGEAEGIICWKLNRLARNPIDGGKIQWLLQQGIVKSILTPARQYLPTDNVLMMAFELGMATQFSLDLSVDVSRGMKSKVDKGWRPHKAPLGYLNDPAGLKGEKKIYTDPETFPIVKKMWHTLLSGMYSVRQLRDMACNEWGLRSMHGGKLSLSGVYKIFTNPFYYGEYYYKEELQQGKQEAMISKLEFDVAQKILGRAGKPRPRNKRLPFNGVIACGECGSMITADEKIKFIVRDNKPKQLIYHRCTKGKKDAVCHQKPIKYEDLFSQVSNYLDSITIPTEFLDWSVDILQEQNKVEVQTRTAILARHHKNYQDCMDKINNLINLFVSKENLGREMLTDEEYKVQKNGLMAERNEIQEQIKKVEANTDQWMDLTEKTFHFATYAKTWFEKGDFEKKTQILMSIGQNFTLRDGKLHIDLQKPFLTLKEGLETEPLKTAMLEPTINYRNMATINGKNTRLESVFSHWSG